SGDEAALRGIQVADVGEIGSGAQHLDVFHGQVAALDLNVVILFGSNRGGKLHTLAQSLVILVGNQRTLLRFDPGIFAGDDAEAVDQENVGTKIGDAIGDVEVEARDHAHDNDQGEDGENHAEEREEAAELVGSQGVQGELDGFRGGDPGSAESFQPDRRCQGPSR